MSPCSPLPHGKPPIAIAIAIGYLRPPSLSTAKNNILLPELLEFASVKRAREQKSKRDPSHEEMGFGPSDQFQDMFLYYIYIHLFFWYRLYIHLAPWSTTWILSDTPRDLRRSASSSCQPRPTAVASSKVPRAPTSTRTTCAGRRFVVSLSLTYSLIHFFSNALRENGSFCSELCCERRAED